MRVLAIAISVWLLSSASAIANASVVAEIRSQTRAAIGERWENVAVRIAFVESRYNPRAIGPKTKYGRAAGVFQVMPRSAKALGFEYKRLTQMKYGIAAGVAHMQMCIAHGVKTDSEMAACHLKGVGGWRRNSKTKAKYIAKVLRAQETSDLRTKQETFSVD